MSQEAAQEKVTQLLNAAYWLPHLEPNIRYVRTHDDHDGTFFPKISLIIDEQGDARLGTVSLASLHSLRFRTHAGGGMSLRVRNALLILAEAIRQDSLERPIADDQEG